MANVKIKFVKHHEVQDEHAGTDKATVYEAGLTKAFEERSAQHFVTRGVAEYVSGSDKTGA
ncbi:hypothetical protein CEW89_08440 [Celeribacter ethanolicus]|uniref:Uncharacterized protein n=1 Tax=Celeribacter ethanolicus TaxID=1758178 RepID=A0A291GBN4_9RHOB|nr:hypothetical protein [Celeribacter ethanolicus]ATG47601.1 hypothetical protein CEW89_08440 [Celeribacter ethanolicus]